MHHVFAGRHTGNDDHPIGRRRLARLRIHRVLSLVEGDGANRVQAERANCEVYEGGNETRQVRH